MILEVSDLRVRFPGHDAVRGITFDVDEGETVALTGASGAGKTAVALAVMGLLPREAESDGAVWLLGEQLLNRADKDLCKVRGSRLAMVFQDPLAALTPVRTVGAQLAEAVRTHAGGDRAAARERAAELFDRVELSQALLDVHPHRLSGGERQRVMIAMAVAHEPVLIVADEPTAALDAPSRPLIMDVLRQASADSGAALLLISHDRAAVRKADRALVLRGGVLGGSASPARIPRPRREPTPLPAGTSPVLRVAGVTSGVLHDVRLTVREAETLCLVGESGAGKTTLLREILRLKRPPEGAIEVCGQDTASLTRAERKALRAQIQVVFQDPYTSLDPRMVVGDIIAEPLRVHRQVVGDRVKGLLEMVGLKPEAAERYPSAFSGGQRQRIAIARALALRPRLLLLDEPVSALDPDVREGVLALLADLRDRLGVACLLVSHDLDVVRRIADRVAVMRSGRIVETGAAEQVFTAPGHAYTRTLLEAR